MLRFHSLIATLELLRGWRITAEQVLFGIPNSMKPYPSVFHAYTSELALKVMFEPEHVDEASKHIPPSSQLYERFPDDQNRFQSAFKNMRWIVSLQSGLYISCYGLGVRVVWKLFIVMYVCMYVCAYVRTCVCVYVCMCVCVGV